MSLAFIPSPGTGTIDLGPLTIHMYGLTLLVAIAACILLTGYRWTKRGGDWDLVLKVAVWGVACLLYTSPSPRDGLLSRMPSSA